MIATSNRLYLTHLSHLVIIITISHSINKASPSEQQKHIYFVDSLDDNDMIWFVVAHHLKKDAPYIMYTASDTQNKQHA